jgi:flagellar basal body-associated protein FliL
MKWVSMTDPNRRRPDLLPIIILLAIVAVVVGGIWLFPYFQSVAEHQNCVAVGRTDCG